MSIALALLLMLAQSEQALPPCRNRQSDCKPWERAWPQRPNFSDQFDPKPERLGPGPHTLVISDGNQITRMDYKSGLSCQQARDAIRKQVAPPADTP